MEVLNQAVPLDEAWLEVVIPEFGVLEAGGKANTIWQETAKEANPIWQETAKEAKTEAKTEEKTEAKTGANTEAKTEEKTEENTEATAEAKEDVMAWEGMMAEKEATTGANVDAGEKGLLVRL